MANFIVLATVDVPVLGQTVNGTIYRGDHLDAAAAVNAAAVVLKSPTGTPMWVLDEANMTRYLITETRSFSSAIG